ncbi:hypothetical protein [Spirosoma jeollabukense]
MEALNQEIINPVAILTNLKSKLQAVTDLSTLYLSRPQTDSQPDTSTANQTMNALGIQKAILPWILQLMGIRSLTLRSQQDLTQLTNFRLDLTNVASEQHRWHYLRNDTIVAELQALFRQCQSVAFDDWSRVVSASDLWIGLLTDVIQPIDNKNIEFIFYLGDPLTKLSFQVDEALDIISDFSRYGQITFALDEHEAINLWMVLNGVQPQMPVLNQHFLDLKRKYMSIFRAMNIARLLIYSPTNAMLFTRQEQFILARRKVAPLIEMAPDARQHFIEGYSIGLLHQLDMAQCLALGLIVFGSYGEVGVSPDLEALIAYINQWVDDLQQPEAIYLYQ